MFDLGEGKCCKSRLGIFENKSAQANGGGEEMVPEEPLTGDDGGVEFVQVGDDLDDDLLSVKLAKCGDQERRKSTYIAPFYDSKIRMAIH